MALNPDKSKAILLDARQLSHRYSNLTTVDVAGCQTPLYDHIKLLGVTLDKNFTMDNHITSVSKSLYYHIRASCHIRSSITPDMAMMVTMALVGSSLDYMNSVLYGTTQKKFPNFRKLKISWHMSCLISTDPIPTYSFSSFTGFLLNT